jgi:hypothetical protein
MHTTINRERVWQLWDITANDVSPAIVAAGMAGAIGGAFYRFRIEEDINKQLYTSHQSLLANCENPANGVEVGTCKGKISSYIEQNSYYERELLKMTSRGGLTENIIGAGLIIASLGVLAKIFDRKVKNILLSRKSLN